MRDIIEELSILGYSTTQLSQLIKMQQLGIDISPASENSDILIRKSIEEYRTLKDLIAAKTYTKSEMNAIFLAFCKNLNYKIIDGKKMSVEQDIFIIRIMLSQFERGCVLDLSPACNVSYSIEFMRDIVSDIEEGVDVKIYLESSLDKKRKELLRKGLKRGIDLSSALSKFTFLKDSDLDVMETIIKRGYDYEEVLKKMKDTTKALFVLENRKDGVDILPVVNDKMSQDVLNEIVKKVKEGMDLTPIKSMPITDVNSIDLLLKIKKTYFPMKYCKGYNADRLEQILEAVEAKIPKEEINEIIKMPSLGVIKASIQALKFGRSDLVDFFKKNLMELMFRRYNNGIIILLNYNSTHKKQYDILRFIQDSDGNWTDEVLFEYLVLCIADDEIDYDMCLYILENGYNKEQARVLNEAHKKGYDVLELFDPRLDCGQMNAILTCLELGLEVKKTKDYDLEAPRKKNNRYRVERMIDGYGDTKLIYVYDNDTQTKLSFTEYWK